MIRGEDASRRRARCRDARYDASGSHENVVDSRSRQAKAPMERLAGPHALLRLEPCVAEGRGSAIPFGRERSQHGPGAERVEITREDLRLRAPIAVEHPKQGLPRVCR